MNVRNFLLVALLVATCARADIVDTTQTGATLSGTCGGSGYSVTSSITYHFNRSTMKLTASITFHNSGYICSGGYGIRKNGVVIWSASGAQPFGPSGGTTTTDFTTAVDVVTGDVITSDFSTTYTIPAGCGSQTIDFWVDNRVGTAARTVKFAVVEGSTVTSIPVSASINAGTVVATPANTETTIAIGSVGHFTASGNYCGTIKMYEKGADGVFFEMPSDPPTQVESREPDPPPIPLPTITDPSTAAVAPVPNPAAAFPQRVTDGGMTEDRWTKGILDVLRASGSGTVVMAENSRTIAQAAAYDAARLQNIDANIALLTRNSNEERNDRTANYARMDAIKNNTKDIADALKEGISPTQQTFDSTSNVTNSANASSVTDTVNRLLPAAPSITLPQSEHTWTFSFTPPGLTEQQTVSIDFSNYDVGITVFKTVVRAALALAFFFMTVKAIRNSVAG